MELSESARVHVTVLTEDTILDAITVAARRHRARVVTESRTESSAWTADEPRVLTDLHWLAAVARPPRSAPKVRCCTAPWAPGTFAAVYPDRTWVTMSPWAAGTFAAVSPRRNWVTMSPWAPGPFACDFTGGISTSMRPEGSGPFAAVSPGRTRVTMRACPLAVRASGRTSLCPYVPLPVRPSPPASIGPCLPLAARSPSTSP